MDTRNLPPACLSSGHILTVRNVPVLPLVSPYTNSCAPPVSRTMLVTIILLMINCLSTWHNRQFSACKNCICGKLLNGQCTDQSAKGRQAGSITHFIRAKTEEPLLGVGVRQPWESRERLTIRGRESQASSNYN